MYLWHSGEGVRHLFKDCLSSMKNENLVKQKRNWNWIVKKSNKNYIIFFPQDIQENFSENKNKLDKDQSQKSIGFCNIKYKFCLFTKRPGLMDQPQIKYSLVFKLLLGDFQSTDTKRTGANSLKHICLFCFF